MHRGRLFRELIRNKTEQNEGQDQMAHGPLHLVSATTILIRERRNGQDMDSDDTRGTEANQQSDRDDEMAHEAFPYITFAIILSAIPGAVNAYAGPDGRSVSAVRSTAWSCGGMRDSELDCCDTAHGGTDEYRANWNESTFGGRHAVATSDNRRRASGSG
jgi:hypothetical protein